MNPNAPCRVLVIDGAAAGARSAAARLATREPGRLVVAAVRGLAGAAEHLRHHRPDCALLDLDGSDRPIGAAVRALREYLPCAPLIALAAGSDERAAIAAIRAGADDCLDRERLDAALLCRAIEIALARGAARSHLMGLALRDLLTGLANRTQFRDALERAVARADRSSQVLALLHLDLDDFAAINNAHGHFVGDALLKAVAARFASQVRAGDTLARVGGDEFALILENVSSHEAAAAVGRKLLAALGVPVIVENEAIPIACSVGIAFHPADGESVDDLIRSADLAMHAAKHRGGGRIGSFSGLLLDAAPGPEGLRPRGLPAGQLPPVLYPAAADPSPALV